MKKLLEIYQYRELLKNLVTTELKLRYRRSILGFMWTMLNPLLMMVVLSVVFSTVMRFAIKDYVVLLVAGLLPWIFFTQSVNLSLMSIVGKGPLLQKVYIPKVIIPLAAVLSSLVNFALALIPLFLLVAAVGHPITRAIAIIPLSILILFLFTCGISFIFACLNVYFRDFTHITEVLIQAWFYLSPVIYRADMIPEAYRPLFAKNPMVSILECFRVPIYDGQFPSVQLIASGLISALFAFIIGFAIFLRFERHFVLRV